MAAQHDYQQRSLLAIERRGSLTVAIIQIAAVAVKYGSHLVFARWLGPAGYGFYSVGLSAGQITAIAADAGLGRSSIRLLPEYRSRNDIAAVNGIFFFSLVLTLVLSAVLAAIATLIIVLGLHSAAETTTKALLAGVALTPVIAFANVTHELARGAHRIGPSFATFLLLGPIVLLLITALLIITSATRSATILLGATGLSLVVSGLALCHMVVRALRVRLQPRRVDLRKWLSLGLPLLAITGLFTILSQAGTVALGILSTTADAGRYAAAFKTATLIGIGVAAINGRVTPAIASLHAQSRTDDLRTLLIRARRWSFFPAAVLATVATVAADPILAAFGPTFVEARNAFIVILAAQLVDAFVGPLGSYLQYTEQHGRALKALAVSAGTSLATSILLIPSMGLLGASLGFLTFSITWNCWLLFVARRQLRLPLLPV